MKPFFVIGLLALLTFFSCDKSVDSQELSGKWIEKSQRLDTIDFAPPFTGAYDSIKGFQLRSRPYMDATINPTYPVNPSSIFSYYTKADSIYVYNFISSNSAYKPFTFSITGNSFTLGRFYMRNTLPATVEFIRLQ